MSRFLSYVVQCFLAERLGDLKEYAIGVEVFDRKVDYDTRVDPVVRVEARRLRDKLSEYYRSHARPGELVISLPKGSYAPLFSDLASTDAAARPATRTIAVLRFDNLSSDTDAEYFSDGLTHELIHRLTSVKNLKVVAWSTAARIIGSEQEVLLSARNLGIAFLLTGSVRISGDRLRVLAQLIDTADDAYLWTETYDRRMHDIFAIQDEIAAAIARALADRLGTPVGIPAAGARNLEAYKFYLQGRFHLNKRSGAGLRRAAELFSAAIEIDPGFAAAHAGYADTYTLLADYTHEVPSEALPKAKAAALRALELDPGLGEAQASLALILSIYEWRWDAAESRYREAIRLNPGYVSAHHWFGIDHLMPLGRFAEGHRELDAALELDPLSPIVREAPGMLYMIEKRFAEALCEYAAVQDLDPFFYKAYTGMGRVHLLTGNYSAAIDRLEEGRRLAGDLPTILAALGQAHALSGNTPKAHEFLGQLRALAETGFVPYSGFAIVQLGLGQKEAALDALERGCERHDPSCAAIGVHPVYEPLHQEERFQQLVRRVFPR
jgi:TolB-like protein/Flp pilus assembly protein TadD